jgi:hypothetical protein
MMLTRCLVLPLGLFLMSTAGYGSDVKEKESENLWFAPSLSINRNPICNSVLQAARANFRSSSSSWDGLEITSLSRASGPYDNGENTDPSVQIDAENPALQIIDEHGKKLFVQFRTNPGCGGACESESLLVSDSPFSADTESDESKVASTPAANTWSLYKSADGTHFIIGTVGAHVQVYKLVPPKAWGLSCDISVEPADPHQSTNPSVKNAVSAIDDLEAAAKNLWRSAGSCGSMGTAGRWSRDVDNALTQALYRPWALNFPKYQSENSYGDWGRIVDGLKLWSLTGPSENTAYKMFEAELPRASQRISEFYVKAFGWTVVQSQAMATEALTGALSRGFGFYLYEPFEGEDEIALRTAIAEHRPMSDITALRGVPDLHRMDTESILVLAIQYPEALKYLIKSGARPDEPNAFGKTPLMYAAQYDQLESAIILLDAGADPNASTYIPQDTCYYTLRTNAMTPLHYAVRYGSAPLINLLLDRGALTFANSTSDTSSQGYPIDWLRRYTDSSVSGEVNSKISPDDLKVLSSKLQLPDRVARVAVGQTLVTRAEAEYASGQAERAFRTLRSSLRADEKNEKAIEDLPIVALRADRPADAMQAADNALSNFKAPPRRASALFNKALACQYISGQSQKESWQAPGMCRQDFMQMFVTSYDMDSTPARTKALVQILSTDGPSMCTLDSGGGAKMRIWEYGGFFGELWSISKYAAPKVTETGYRVYIFHRSAELIDLNSIHWVTPAGGYRAANQPVEASPHLIATYNVGNDALTIVEADFTRSGVRGEVLLIGDQRCEFNYGSKHSL